MNHSAFQSAKLWLVDVVGLSKDALHIYVGLAVFLVAVYLLRRRSPTVVPLLFVFAVAVAGEILDARDDLRGLGHWRWRASLHDIVNTMFWPLVLWSVWRLGFLSKDAAPKGQER